MVDTATLLPHCVRGTGLPDGGVCLKKRASCRIHRQGGSAASERDRGRPGGVLGADRGYYRPGCVAVAPKPAQGDHQAEQEPPATISTMRTGVDSRPHLPRTLLPAGRSPSGPGACPPTNATGPPGPAGPPNPRRKMDLLSSTMPDPIAPYRPRAAVISSHGAVSPAETWSCLFRNRNCPRGQGRRPTGTGGPGPGWRRSPWSPTSD